jgi:Arc/MetJ-type ribon-helix-helix transcriptional regulator
MRVHISLDEELVREIDRRAGKGRRSAFIERSVRQTLDDAARWDLIWSAVGGAADEGHEWDDDAAAWVARQRRLDPSRVG